MHKEALAVVNPTEMAYLEGPQTWNQWFREGSIYEVEFFHGLVSCARDVGIAKVLAVLREDERERFQDMLCRLVSLGDSLGGQMVTSVARYGLDDARRVLEQLEAAALAKHAPE